MRSKEPDISTARFAVGDVVHHRMFDYRGVIFDVDPQCRAPDEWYENVALSRPPRDKPWYHVLVHDAAHTTYVAERNLEPDTSGDAVRHPALDEFFTRFDGRRYVREFRDN